MERCWRLWISVLVCLSSFAFASSARADGTLQVTVSILPQKFLVQQIAGDLVKVAVMVPPGANPASYEPKPRQVVAMAGSKIYLAIGVPFENSWLRKFAAANPNMLLVHTEAGIARRAMESEIPYDISPGSNGSTEKNHQEHSHAGMKDPHIWLSPPLVMLQARNILSALVEIDPAHQDVYEANYQHFIAQLAELDMKIGRIFWERQKTQPIRFMVFHPAWGYFAAAYGLQQIPVEVEGKEPKARDLQKLIIFAQKQKIKVVFVQPEFSTRNAETIAQAVGGRTVFADPLAEDWAKNLFTVAERIAAAAQ